MVGTPITQGFVSTTGAPVEAARLDGLVVWASTSAALAGIDVGSRSVGMTIVVVDTEYWFMPDVNTLVAKPTGSTDAADIDITDAADYFTSTKVEGALQEVGSDLSTLSTAVGLLKATTYVMNMPTGNLATKVAVATFTPTGWATVAVDNSVNALVTHTLTGRKPVTVKVWEIDGSTERLTKDFSDAYSGLLAGALTVNIEGINPTALALRVEFIFD